MKFKGSLVDPTALLNVLSALEKLGTACIMNLSPTKIDFFMSKEFTKGDECFVDVTMSSVFENISISSLNDDQIPLHIDIGNLMRAIRSATSAVACTVKLTKKMAQPCLTFELQRSQHDHSITIQVCCLYPSRRSSVLFVISYSSACRVARVCACVGSVAHCSRQICNALAAAQDVPIKLESIRRLAEVAEPDLPPPDVKILMPKLRVLARVLDKMKTVCSQGGNALPSSDQVYCRSGANVNI
jgi:hypothetical protein